MYVTSCVGYCWYEITCLIDCHCEITSNIDIKSTTLKNYRWTIKFTLIGYSNWEENKSLRDIFKRRTGRTKWIHHPRAGHKPSVGLAYSTGKLYTLSCTKAKTIPTVHLAVPGRDMFRTRFHSQCLQPPSHMIYAWVASEKATPTTEEESNGASWPSIATVVDAWQVPNRRVLVSKPNMTWWSDENRTIRRVIEGTRWPHSEDPVVERVVRPHPPHCRTTSRWNRWTSG